MLDEAVGGQGVFFEGIEEEAAGDHVDRPPALDPAADRALEAGPNPLVEGWV